MGLDVQILLDNATRSYYPGEAVSGQVLIVSDKERNVKGLKLKFHGNCKVAFSELERRRTSRRRVDYQHVEVNYGAEEVYLHFELNIFGNDGQQVTFPTGRYLYPFSYQLPLGLPSSYEGLHGNITYSLAAEISRSWSPDCIKSLNFRVLGSVDLNFNPEAQQEGLMTQRQSFGCCCCKGGVASFVLKIPKRGVVVGEFIPFVVEINNKSNKTLAAKISLIQDVKFYAQGKQRKVANVICAVEGPSILPGDDDIWRGNVLQVPPVVPTRLGTGCHLIDITYQLKMELTGSGIFSRLRAKTPIVIGTLPFRDSSQMDHTIYEPPPSYQSVVQSSSASAPTASAPGAFFHPMTPEGHPGPPAPYYPVEPK